MTLTSLAQLDRFKTSGHSPTVAHLRTFYSPVDDVHGALLAVIGSATRSLVVAMYGFDDNDLADTVAAACTNPAITVQLTFDASQAAGAHERLILGRESYPATSIAIGHSERGAIMHLKMAVVDDRWTVHGSTNWGDSAEHLQDNELVVIDSPTVASEAAARIDAIHAHMLTAQPQPTSAVELRHMAADGLAAAARK